MRASKRLIVLCVILGISVVLGACGSKGNAQEETVIAQTAIGGISTGEHVVLATVNGEDVFEDVFMEWYLETMAVTMSLDMTAQQDAQVVEFLEAYKMTYLADYLDQIVLLQEAKRAQILVGDQDVEGFLRDLMMNYMTDEAGFQSIQAMWGFTDESIRRFVRNQIAIQRLFEEITKDITAPALSPEEYYNTYPMEFQVDELRLVRHILVEDEEEAWEIIDLLDNGADFYELVQERSVDFDSLIYGGTIGPFDSFGSLSGGGGTLLPIFTEASYSLSQVGDYSQEPVASEFGYHIIILDDVAPSYMQAFDEVKDDLAYQLLMDAKEQRFSERYTLLMDQAEIVYAEGYMG